MSRLPGVRDRRHEVETGGFHAEPDMAKYEAHYREEHP
jgi:hypothetical protein